MPGMVTRPRRRRVTWRGMRERLWYVIPFGLAVPLFAIGLVTGDDTQVGLVLLGGYCLLLLIFLAAYLPKFIPRVRRYNRSLLGQCPGCGYDLTGHVSGVCPECGTPVELAG